MRETDNVVLTRQHDAPTHTFIHASDTQLTGDRGLWNGYPLDADEKLADLVTSIEKTGISPDAIIFTGDLADKGEPEAYIRLREAFQPVAERLDTELIWVMGNHDKRDALRTHLLDEPESLAPIDKVYEFNGLRVISLDSSVPGHHYGLVSSQQLEWLEHVLSEPFEHGTILALHHPPIPSVLPLAQVVELQDQNSLADVVKGKNIRSIIAGHLHYSSFGIFAGIPVSVASSSCYTQDLAVQLHTTAPRNGAQGFNLINVYENTIIHSVVPIGYTEPVGQTVLPDEVHALLQQEGLL